MLINLNSEDRTGGTNEAPTFDFTNLGRHHTKNGGQVGVKSIELPYTFFTCKNGINNRFTYTQSDLTTTKTIYLGSNTVTPFEGSPSAATMIALVQAQLNINTDAAVWTLSLDSTTAKVRVSCTKNSLWTAIDPEVFAMLGFSSTTTIPFVANSVYYSDYVVNVNPIKYIFVRANLPISTGHDYDSFSKSSSDIIAKIPVNLNAFSNLFLEVQNVEYRECQSLNAQITFRLTDSKNRSIDLNGVPWSMTMDFDRT